MNQVSKLVEKPENVKFANDLAERSMTLLRNENQVLPLDLKRAGKTLFIIAAGDDDADQGAIFKAAIEQRVKPARVVKVDKRTTSAEYAQLLSDVKSSETVVIGAFVKRAALKGTVALPDEEAEFVRQAISANQKTAVIAFGSPYLLQQFPQAKSYLAAWAVEDVAQTAGVRAIFGETAITGKSPVALPDFFAIGDGLQIKSSKEREKDAKEKKEIFN